jgi:hypothetical protein
VLLCRHLDLWVGLSGFGLVPKPLALLAFGIGHQVLAVPSDGYGRRGKRHVSCTTGQSSLVDGWRGNPQRYGLSSIRH